VLQSTENKRIFLALWPGEETRQQLLEAQKRLKREPVLQTAREVNPDNLHMTLQFIGSISAEVIQKLVTCLDKVDCSGFEMKVTTMGCFPKPRVVWLGLQTIPPELIQLEQHTAACVEQCVEGYQRIPYRPHITLFRKAKISPEQDGSPEISWRVQSFALVESKSHAEGVQYHVLKQWLLSE